MAPSEPPLARDHPPRSTLFSQHPPEDFASDFASLISSLGPPLSTASVSKFVKKLEDTLEIILPPSLAH